MELSQVRHFITLCRALNFTRAAEQCNVSQPAFSRSIQRLEDEFGGPLIFRERNLTQLTELGRAMRPHLEAMLEAAEAARAVATAKLTHGSASLKIGLGPGIGAAMVAGAIREIVANLPNVTIHFEESGPATLAEAMLNDRLDCALVPDDCSLPERLNRWMLYSNRAVAVLPQGHRLLAKNAVSPDDLREETILFSDRCGGFARRLSTVTPYTFQLQHCGGAAAQMLDLVGASLGLALLSNRFNIALPLATRPFEEPELTRGVLLVAVAGRPLNPAAASFVNLCRAQKFD